MIWLCDFVGKIHSSGGNTFSRFQLRYPYRKRKQFSPNFIIEQLPFKVRGQLQMSRSTVLCVAVDITGNKMFSCPSKID